MNRFRYENGGLDETDRQLLTLLAGNARLANAELARKVGMSAPAVAERLRRLEEAGIIRGYTLRVDPAAMGRPIAAIIRIRPIPGKLQQVADLLRTLPDLVECDRVTGEDCFVARAHVAEISDLERLIDRIIPYATTNSSVIQSSTVPRRIAGVPLTGEGG